MVFPPAETNWLEPAITEQGFHVLPFNVPDATEEPSSRFPILTVLFLVACGAAALWIYRRNRA